MYSTKNLSRILNSQEQVSAPPDGPNSGYLVIKDEEAETYSCFGCCKRTTLYRLPLPQNKELIVTYILVVGLTSVVYQNHVFFIPVLDQPLSSNRYYTIDARGEHIGEASTCSTEEDKVTCCFNPQIKDVKQRPLDPRDPYQQFHIKEYRSCGSTSGLYAESTEPNGFPPLFLRRKSWTIASKSTKKYKLEEAHGLNSKLRSQLPSFDFPLSHNASNPNFVGKWYTPFVFVKESITLGEQAKGSPYYEITLEQSWERVFSCNNRDTNKNSVRIDALVEIEEAFINGGNKATWDENLIDDGGFVWFTTSRGDRVGLRKELVERMRWEQERGGYVRGDENQEKISKVEENSNDEWNEFGCFVLVERFNYKRMDGTLVLSCDFRHCHRTKNKWV